jgi:dolichol kinase
MQYDLVSLPVVILFILSGTGLFYYAIKLKKKFSEDHNFTNSILTFILWLFAGIFYPLFFTSYSSNIIFFQTLSMLIICIFTPVLISLILIYQSRIVLKKQPEVKTRRNIQSFLESFDARKTKFSNNRSSKVNTDLHRKALHLFPAGIVVILWVFAVYLWEGLWNISVEWGISGEEFGRFLILTTGYSGILVFAALDYVRLSYVFENRSFFHLIPDNVLTLLTKSMKRKENFEFIRPTVLVLSFVPIFFFPFCIFASAILIATVGDGAASVFGLRFGRMRFPKSSEKTVIGYIAGFIASFAIGFGFILLFGDLVHITSIFIVAFSGGLTFSIIDLLNLKVDDNILNPLFCALVMGSLYFLI